MQVVVVEVVVVVGYCYSMEPFGRNATVLATAVALGLSIRARRKQSLTRAGSLAALAVGFLLVGTGLRGFNLLVFYQIGTSATKHKHHAKAKVDGSLAGARSGNSAITTARGPGQVLACSLLATLLSLLHVLWYGSEQPIVFGDDNGTNDNNYYYNASCLTCGIMAHHATCLADTLASEMGILAKNRPFLITQPWKRVPTGTNGGVTGEGFFWSLVGGFVIGLSTVVFDSLSGLLLSSSSSSSIIATIVRMLLFASTCGLVGSLIDSVLGATIQQTYYDPDTKLVYQANDEGIPKSAQPWVGINLLNNEQVNLVSVALTTAVGGWVLGPMFFP